MTDETDKPTGWFDPMSTLSDEAQQRFMVEQMMGEMSVATLVKVTKVTNTGDVKEVGKVSVLPLVNQIDGQGGSQKHIAVNDIPYMRYQSGNKAIIMDPKVGDIGIMITADRDTSAVRKKKDQANPGSFRRFDMADGMFIPCMLGGKPTSYVQFKDDGTIVVSPDDGKTIIQAEKDKVMMQAGELKVFVRPERIDLGKLDAPFGVETSGGTSTKVFAIVA